MISVLLASRVHSHDGKFSREEVRKIIFDVRDLRNRNKMLKIVGCGLFLLALASISSVFVVVLVGNEITKEERINTDGEMTDKTTGSTVSVGRASSISSMWDAPALAPEAMSYMSELKCFVDMTNTTKHASWVEMNFKLGSSYQVDARLDEPAHMSLMDIP